MKRRLVAAAASLAALCAAAGPPNIRASAQIPAALPYPRQPPLAPATLESCRGAEYSDEEYRAMAAVREVPSARAQFPGSYMFVPAGRGPHPGVLLLHGSGGGRYTPGRSCLPRLLAARGYAALAFCYFDCGDDAIPEALSDVDLQRTYEAMLWLTRSAHVSSHRVAISGASRGAEQAVLLASLLGQAATTDRSIVLPDAVHASAPYGRVVGAFNWRARADDERWQRVREAHAACVREPECTARPALDASECWADDTAGEYVGPNGRRSWVTSRCAARPNRQGIFDRPAWRWPRDSRRVRPGAEIELQHYPGPILVVHGAVDPVWSVTDGPDRLRETLTRTGIRSHYEVVPRFDKRVEAWPRLPADRVLFYIFAGEPHLFSPHGSIARRSLLLAFLERTVKHGTGPGVAK